MNNLLTLINKKDSVLQTGYDQSDFTEAYWLSPSETDGIARIEKDTSKVSQYLKDLFSMFGVGNVLDVGAGAGCLVNGLRAAGMMAEGCEFSSSGRKLAREKFNIDLAECDLTKRLPYGDRIFDYATCFGVLSMIPENKMSHAISEIARVVRKAVVVNISTEVSPYNGQDMLGNPHHITAMTTVRYYKLFTEYFRDGTSILPPLREKYGIGICNEFSGLFLK